MCCGLPEVAQTHRRPRPDADNEELLSNIQKLNEFPWMFRIAFVHFDRFIDPGEGDFQSLCVQRKLFE